jgi:polyisoprenoid-binding protein YceI
MAVAQRGTTGVRFVMDRKLSQFTVQAFASGLISGVAHSPKIAIRDWTGETKFTPESLQGATLTVTGRTSSLEVLDELRESERREIHRVMFQEVLEVSGFPDFRFEGLVSRADREREDLYRVNVSGQLKLHGVTSSHSFSAQVAFGVDSFRAYGEFTILQTDYDMKVASIAGGTLKLQNELKCSFYVMAKKQE